MGIEPAEPPPHASCVDVGVNQRDGDAARAEVPPEQRDPEPEDYD